MSGFMAHSVMPQFFAFPKMVITGVSAIYSCLQSIAYQHTARRVMYSAIAEAGTLNGVVRTNCHQRRHPSRGAPSPKGRWCRGSIDEREEGRLLGLLGRL